MWSPTYSTSLPCELISLENTSQLPPEYTRSLRNGPEWQPMFFVLFSCWELLMNVRFFFLLIPSGHVMYKNVVTYYVYFFQSGSLFEEKRLTRVNHYVVKERAPISSRLFVVQHIAHDFL
jgi:hypothetical protein